MGGGGGEYIYASKPQKNFTQNNKHKPINQDPSTHSTQYTHVRAETISDG